MNIYEFKCPHCGIRIEVLENEVNCRIFRCGIFKNNLQQINPHLKKEECEKLVNRNLIYGCGKPFRMNSENKLEECEYF